MFLERPENLSYQDYGKRGKVKRELEASGE